MKKLYLFTLAATMALFSACSSSEDVVEEAPQVSTEETVSPFGADGVGYINVSINLPTAPASRAGTENDQFADGTAEEYAVKNATLLLFDNSKKFHSSYDLGLSMNLYGTTSDNITTQSQIITKLKDAGAAGSGEPKYGLVIVNKNSLTMPSSGTFDEWNTAISTTAGALTTTGFTMANVVQATATGGTAAASQNIYTLVDISGAIKKTKAEAEANAVEFYLERAVGKVELNGFDTSTGKSVNLDFGVKNFGTEVLKGEMTGTVKRWMLVNTNNSTYPVRKWPEAAGNTWLGYDNPTPAVTDKPRFVGKVATPYRTYWAEDPNYNIDASDPTGLNTATDIASVTQSNIYYCLENTFDVTSQMIRNTTCALLEVEIKRNTDATAFYLIDGNKSTLYNAALAKTFVEGYVISNYATEIENYATANSFSGTVSVNATIPTPSQGGKVTLDNVKISIGSSGEIDFETVTSKTYDELSNALDIQFYKDALAYYLVPIQHFGDELTPWSDAAISGSESYPGTDNAKKWLGRYGILRNNWYDIDVTKVLQIGTAAPGDLDVSTWDDNIQQYIACRINVLSWAKRIQSVTLQ